MESFVYSYPTKVYFTDLPKPGFQNIRVPLTDVRRHFWTRYKFRSYVHKR